MATLIVMPKLGMTMEEGTVTEWPKGIGERVERGEVVLVIETEKSEAEVEATASGFLRHLYVEVGNTVPSGTPLAVLTATADEELDAEALLAEHLPEASLSSSARSSAPAAIGLTAASGSDVSSTSEKPPSRTRDRVAVTPRARRLARELGIDPGEVPGTGPGDRVTEDDVRAWAERRAALIEVESGVGLEVLADGAGDSVLLIPGFGADGSLWALQTPALVPSFRALLMSPRGVGHSDAPDGDQYTIARNAADAEAILRRLEAEPAHIVGSSLGAATALELTLEHPDCVRSLVLLSPFVTASHRLLAVLDSWPDLVEHGSPELVAQALLPWLFGESLLADPAARERTCRGLTDMVGRSRPEVLRRWAAGIRSWSGSRTAELDRIAVPTLILIGEQDLLTPPQPNEWQALPDVRIEIIPGAGHALGLEAAELVNRLLLEHLGQR